VEDGVGREMETGGGGGREKMERGGKTESGSKMEMGMTMEIGRETELGER
jgi:hypothetical protein